MTVIANLKRVLRRLGFEDGYQADCGMIYLASMRIGPNTARIKRFLGAKVVIADKTYSDVSWRLRQQGIWRSGKVYTDIKSKKNATLSICLEIMCAAGLVEREYEHQAKWKRFTLADRGDKI